MKDESIFVNESFLTSHTMKERKAGRRRTARRQVLEAEELSGNRPARQGEADTSLPSEPGQLDN